MRASIAAQLTPASLDRLTTLQESLRRQIPELQAQTPQQPHLTLAFLGEQLPATLEETAELVLSVGGQTAAIRTRPQGLRLLGHGVRKRPLCLMLEAVPELLRLQNSLNLGLEALGIETEKRPYRPHLTLARIAPPLPRQATLAKVQFDPTLELSFERLVLYRSFLLPQGAQHSPLAEIILAEKDAAN